MSKKKRSVRKKGMGLSILSKMLLSVAGFVQEKKDKIEVLLRAPKKHYYFLITASFFPILILLSGIYILSDEFIHSSYGDRKLFVSSEKSDFDKLVTLGAYMEFVEPQVDDYSSESGLEVEIGIATLNSLQYDDSDICIGEIYGEAFSSYYKVGEVEQYILENVSPVYSLDNFCQDRDISVHQTPNQMDDLGWIPVNYRNLRYEKYFPLDEREVTFYLWVEAYQENGAAFPLVPEVYLSSKMAEWNEEVHFTKRVINVNGEDLEALEVNVIFKRPLTTRLFTFVILGTLYLFVTLLLFVKDTGSALEVSLGILLGLWGIQEIIRPPTLGTITLVDTLILVLYFYFALIAVLRFITVPLYQKLGG